MNTLSPMTWYVSYVASGDLSGDRVPRATRTFADESAARTFAKARFKAGDRMMLAGTINPVTPKRVIPSSAIPDWMKRRTDSSARHPV